jgi:hypothetical protein
LHVDGSHIPSSKFGKCGMKYGKYGAIQTTVTTLPLKNREHDKDYLHKLNNFMMKLTTLIHTMATSSKTLKKTSCFNNHMKFKGGYI